MAAKKTKADAATARKDTKPRAQKKSSTPQPATRDTNTTTTTTAAAATTTTTAAAATTTTTTAADEVAQTTSPVVVPDDFKKLTIYDLTNELKTLNVLVPPQSRKPQLLQLYARAKGVKSQRSSHVPEEDQPVRPLSRERRSQAVRSAGRQVSQRAHNDTQAAGQPTRPPARALDPPRNNAPVIELDEGDHDDNQDDDYHVDPPHRQRPARAPRSPVPARPAPMQYTQSQIAQRIRRNAWQGAYARPNPNEPVALAHYGYTAGEIDSIERERQLAIIPVTQDPNPIYYSQRGYEMTAFKKIREDRVGSYLRPVPSRELLKWYHTLARRCDPLVASHFESTIFVYPHFDQMLCDHTHNELVAMSFRSAPHDAYLTSYRHFLGHIAAMWYFVNVASEGRTLSGLAKTFYCTPDQLMEDIDKVQKREVADPVTTHKGWLILKFQPRVTQVTPHVMVPCRHCAVHNPARAHTHEWAQCGVRPGGIRRR